MRQLFKPITLALTMDGVAMHRTGQLPVMLGQSSLKLETNELLLDAFKGALQNESVQQSGRRIRLVVSNHFVRYTVLPWQGEVASREDWFGIARHNFSEIYGAVAEHWKICVSLNGFAHNVVASAIDESLFEGLSNIASEQACKLVSIEPFLMSVIKKSQYKTDPSWLIIAEPERVLLCEVANDQWQRFSVISPPKGQEVEQALLLIHRTLQSTELEKQPNSILHCSAPSLSVNTSAIWSSERVTLKPLLINVAMNQPSPAIWMAGF